MTKQELADYLSENYSKKSIEYLVELLRKNDLDIRSVLELSLDGTSKRIVFRASWLLEEVVYNCTGPFVGIAKEFVAHYKFQKNISARRHYSKIAMSITRPRWIEFYKLSNEDIDNIIEGSFEWLIDESTPVAVKCNCLDVLYNLASYQDWILDELKPILEQGLVSDSPALISRTKGILQRLQK